MSSVSDISAGLKQLTTVLPYDYPLLVKFQESLSSLIPGDIDGMIARTLFRNVTQIGEGTGSLYGTVMALNQKGVTKSMAVIKTAPIRVTGMTNADETETIRREFVIGKALNSLRPYLANFMYVYGMFNCNTPADFVDRFTPIAFCNNDGDQVPYIVFENILKAPTLESFMARPKRKLSEIVEVCLQVACALKFANEKFDFCHNDLHDRNILVQILPQTYEMRLPYKGDYIYINTKFRAVIIDYGFSHAYINGVHYGETAEAGRIYGDRSFPQKDIFMFLYSLNRFASVNHKEFNEKLLQFVGASDPDFAENLEVLDNLKKDYSDLIEFFKDISEAKAEPMNLNPKYYCSPCPSESMEIPKGTIETFLDILLVKPPKSFYSEIIESVTVNENKKIALYRDELEGLVESSKRTVEAGKFSLSLAMTILYEGWLEDILRQIKMIQDAYKDKTLAKQFSPLVEDLRPLMKDIAELRAKGREFAREYQKKALKDGPESASMIQLKRLKSAGL